MAERGIAISDESIRLWCIKFGPNIGRSLSAIQTTRLCVLGLRDGLITESTLGGLSCSDINLSIPSLENVFNYEPDIEGDDELPDSMIIEVIVEADETDGGN